MHNDAKRDLEYALAFTETYRRETEKLAREAACLRLQVPYVLAPIAEDDLVAGLMRHGFVGFSPQHGGEGAQYTYYFHDHRVAAALEKCEADAAFSARVEAMRAFWKTEKTTARAEARFCGAFPRGVCNPHRFGFVA